MASDAPPAETGADRVAALTEDDPRQALRFRRYLMAAGTSMLAVGALFGAHLFGLLPWLVAVEGTAIIVALALIFYLLFRFRLNRYFDDPSLTTEMIVCSIIVLAYLMYHAPGARDALSLFYPVAMLFGVLRLSDSNRQLKIAFERIEQVAIHDDLTGVFNRRFLMDVLARESSRAKRLGTATSVCLFDLDHFKGINDTLGHGAGDAVLKHFALLAGTGLRAVDVFGRYGGEEFLLVLPDTGLQGACASAERIRVAVEAAGFPQLPAERRVTATIGVATSRPEEDIQALIGRADAALYQGKAAGRNRIVAVG